MSNKEYIKFLSEEDKGRIRVPGHTPRFIKERCTGAGVCKEVCPADAVLGDPRQRTISIHHGNCIKCSLCIKHCSSNALV